MRGAARANKVGPEQGQTVPQHSVCVKCAVCCFAKILHEVVETIWDVGGMYSMRLQQLHHHLFCHSFLSVHLCHRALRVANGTCLRRICGASSKIRRNY